jgi:GNAT superfamily N-acetyltransferase
MSAPEVSIKVLAGEQVEGALPALARLRIDVFRAYPYLYAGSDSYERTYLRTFAGSADSIIVVAETADRDIVGCSTGAAISAHHAEFSGPLVSAGIPVSSTFYFGESVLRPEFRGRGIGHAFFDAREAHARALGYSRVCFCAVERDANDPRRPDDHRSLEAFWQNRGYRKLDQVKALFEWPEADNGPQIGHSMAYWLRKLDGSA